MGVVYGLCDPGTGDVRYVGKTAKGLRNRVRGHAGGAMRGGRTHKDNWLRSIDYEPRGVVLALGLPEQLDDLERRWITALRAEGARLTNLTDGGEGWRGVRKLAGREDDAIAHFSAGRTLFQTAEEFGVSVGTVFKLCRERRVDTSRGRDEASRIRQLEIYRAGGRAAGATQRGRPKNFSPEAMIGVRRGLDAGRARETYTAQRTENVRASLIKNLEIRRGVSDTQIVEAYATMTTISAVATDLGLSKKSVRHALRRAGAIPKVGVRGRHRGSKNVRPSPLRGVPLSNEHKNKIAASVSRFWKERA